MKRRISIVKQIECQSDRQEALEAAISERDAQLGLLEVSGIKTARAAERADDLRADRKRLMQMMKQQVYTKSGNILV